MKGVQKGVHGSVKGQVLGRSRRRPTTERRPTRRRSWLICLTCPALSDRRTDPRIDFRMPMVAGVVRQAKSGATSIYGGRLFTRRPTKRMYWTDGCSSGCRRGGSKHSWSTLARTWLLT